ncbi:MAG: hypothetical protein KDD46_07955 [Bdellovibrionales bacterium]|nr:hypothetical protein [Bdellovibrionales bacterium]
MRVLMGLLFSMFLLLPNTLWAGLSSVSWGNGGSCTFHCAPPQGCPSGYDTTSGDGCQGTEDNQGSCVTTAVNTCEAVITINWDGFITEIKDVVDSKGNPVPGFKPFQQGK